MRHPSNYVRTHPDKPAIIIADSDQSLTYAELEAVSNRGAHLMRALGLQPTDHIAVMMENQIGVFEVYWAAMRSGLYFTPIATHLTADEAAHIVNDCGAGVVVSSFALRHVACQLPALCPRVEQFFATGGEIEGYESWEDTIRSKPTQPIADEVGGHTMMYSSGTTGRSKGILVPFVNAPIGTMIPIMQAFSRSFGYDSDTVYLSPGPLYHAAPLSFSANITRLGGTVIVMKKFDPESFLRLIEQYRVTHTQVVPTMFVRLLKLPAEIRHRYDLSSLKSALHAAAPCAIAVKEQMIEWWGPIIHEQYSGSEGNGCTMISSQEWLAHKGSVGRALVGTLQIVGDDGKVQPPRKHGTVYFVGSRQFAYHNDPEKTRQAFNDKGWSTLGDVGYLDEEGYLYLTDRKAYMIISGGVNIYPQEAENVLTLHPEVLDVAVFGVPNEEFGEEVKAVVQPVEPAFAGKGLEQELIAYCREHLAALKCPRSIDFVELMPRQENGKLYKRLLRDRYWAGHATNIV